MKDEQHDDGERPGGPETQPEARQQIDEKSADVHYPMIDEFHREYHSTQIIFGIQYHTLCYGKCCAKAILKLPR